MRERLFRIAALVIGLLGMSTLIFQLINGIVVPWRFFAIESVVVVVFIVYGLGLAYTHQKDSQ